MNHALKFIWVLAILRLFAPGTSVTSISKRLLQ